ncbi:ABC transporter substrate-binding protein [Methylomonas fluvii]|uniref:ABC transporter substrate-binding protein n=1 Tax=Methylomonas fluvii TaxID=1854564 RepID=A0ABR9DGW6_9GAMM|nr:ABC transporter substrate-binding protein [Methylomonas fluvii]MBD9362344.1 ABC transporter substrate-binding protein [Methylomonas fluvii]
MTHNKPDHTNQSLDELHAAGCSCCGGISRRDFIKLTSILAAASALPGGFARALEADPKRPLRIGYLPITDASPLLVAHAKGFYQEQGIEVEQPKLFRAWPQLVEAFIAGQIDVIHLLAPTAVLMRYGSKFPAKIVAWNHVNGSALTVAPSINQISDLAGKTVAIPFWFSIHNVILQHLLRQQGLVAVSKPAGTALNTNEVNLVIMPPPDMISALANGSIAGYIVAEPFNAAAENLKIGKILRFTGDVWKSHACCVVFMREADLQQRPEWSQAVVNGIVKAQAWIRDNRQGTAQLLAKESGSNYTPHSQVVLERALSHYDDTSYGSQGALKHADWQQSRIDFQPYPFPSYTKQLVQLLKQTHVEGDNGLLATLDADFVAGDLVDDRFVKVAIDKLGGPKVFGLPDNLSREEILA